ncbi:MerR family transcriptional regulator [Peribacillus sp. SCS-155]|uniref:MerR family transcriptional regulator n=1 Tax=Peribacillus sedimenti TaxID=3115297 RepID=UPI003906D103
MNTSAVARLLGVSTSTIQRWVKQHNIHVDRNDHGHYLFNEETVRQLKNIQNHTGSHTVYPEISSALEPIYSLNIEEVMFKLENLEKALDEKADSVVSYQLLQHRKEIEEMQKQIDSLEARINKLEAEKDQSDPSENILLSNQNTQRRKKHNKFMNMFFGI